MLTFPSSRSRAEVAEPQATAAPDLDADLDWLADRLSAEDRQTMLDEFAKLAAGEPVDDPLDEQWQLTEAELAEFAGKARAFVQSLQGLTLGDLIPSEEELNADPDLEAWFAGIPGAPRPRDSFAAPLPSLRYARPVLRVRTRSREQRPQGQRRVRVRSGSRGDPSRSSDDDPDPARRAVARLDVVEAAR
jgi:hypothetical protein